MINIDKFLKLKLTNKELNKINKDELELTISPDFNLFNAKVVEEAIEKYCYGDLKLSYLSNWIDIYRILIDESSNNTIRRCITNLVTSTLNDDIFNSYDINKLEIEYFSDILLKIKLLDYINSNLSLWLIAFTIEDSNTNIVFVNNTTKEYVIFYTYINLNSNYDNVIEYSNNKYYEYINYLDINYNLLYEDHRYIIYDDIDMPF